MSAVHIASSASAGLLQVPIGAVFDPGTGPGVWVIEGKTPRVVWRTVQLASLDDEAASIVGNLKPGDRVVALGAHLLHEGELVRVAGEAAASGEAVNRVARQ
jgi:multidrug efflux pump subunit AcrA (membrane-fusion protein)